MEKINFDIYALERLALTKPEEFGCLILEIIATEGLEAAIRIIRMSGICVSMGAYDKHEILFKKITSLLKDNFPDNVDIEKFEKEVIFLKYIVKESQEIKKSLFNRVSENTKEFSKILFFLETIFGGAYLKSTGVPDDTIDNIYPTKIDVVPTLQKYDDSSFGRSLYERDKIAIYEFLATRSHLLFKDIMQKDIKLSTGETDFTINGSRYIEYLRRLEILEDIIDVWRFFDANLIFTKRRKISIEIPNLNMKRAFLLSNFRFLSLRTKLDFQLMEEYSSEEFLDETKQLPPQGYRNLEEKIAAALCQEFFFSKNLKELCFEVTLAE